VAVYQSPYPDVDIPDTPLTPFVLARARELGDKPAFVEGTSGRTVSYADVDRGARAVAGGLASRGFGKGDVFALYLPNLPEYPIAYHGIAMTGGTISTVNPLYTAEELAFQLNDAGASYLLTIPQFLEVAKEAAAEAGLKEVFVLGEADGASPFSSLMDPSAPVPDADIDPANDVVVLPYSSGTTGGPKGVMLTHRNLIANLVQVEVAHELRPDDVLLGVLPFFHIYGQIVIMNLALHLGLTSVTMPRFDLEQFLGVIQDHRVTYAHVVPPIVLALAKHPAIDKYDLSSLRVVFSGAAPLGPDLEEACARRLDVTLTQGYGMTEASPATHIRRSGDAGHPGSVGPPVAATEARVVDWATGEDVAPGTDGEIWVRGPQVMKGYLNNPEATARTVDADGWLHTGDIGHADAGGVFFIADRLKELIKYKAYQVPPAELEAILLRHPAVADAAVIPSPDEEAGEIPKAFVVLKPGAEASADDIMAFVAEHVSPQKRIRLVEFTDAIPKSASGKILRRVLVDKERAAVAGT
jgi:acyl-CoA synthetase (AMP-forming)/AMP-acid ligase II